MRKENRLASEADFRRVRAEGRSWAHPLLVLYARRSDGPVFRLGVSTAKRLGTAVKRNRIRRRIRELVRGRLTEIEPGWDVVVIPRSPAVEASFGDLGAALDQLLSRARLSRTRPRPPEAMTSESEPRRSDGAAR